jgi:hypothetical protein
MPSRRHVALLLLVALGSCASFASADENGILFAAVEHEISSLEERNAHYIAWPRVRDGYHVFVAVGETEQRDPEGDVMRELETLSVARRRSEGSVENPRDVVRDIASGRPGEIFWIRRVSLLSDSEALVYAEVITAAWCKTGVDLLCRYEAGRWHVTSRETKWQSCISPLPQAP